MDHQKKKLSYVIQSTVFAFLMAWIHTSTQRVVPVNPHVSIFTESNLTLTTPPEFGYFTNPNATILHPLINKRVKKNSDDSCSDDDETVDYCDGMSDELRRVLDKLGLRAAFRGSTNYMDIFRHQISFLGHCDSSFDIFRDFSSKSQRPDVLLTKKQLQDYNYPETKIICKTLSLLYDTNLDCYFKDGSVFPSMGQDPNSNQVRLSMAYEEGVYFSLITKDGAPPNYNKQSLEDAYNLLIETKKPLGQARQKMSKFDRNPTLPGGTLLYSTLYIRASSMHVIANKYGLCTDSINKEYGKTTTVTPNISPLPGQDDEIEENDSGKVTETSADLTQNMKEFLTQEVAKVELETELGDAFTDEDDSDDENDNLPEDSKLSSPFLDLKDSETYDKLPPHIWYGFYHHGSKKNPSVYDNLIHPTDKTIKNYQMPKKLNIRQRITGIESFDWGVLHEQDGIDALAEALGKDPSEFKSSGLLWDETVSISGVPDAIVMENGKKIPVEIKSPWSCRNSRTIKQFKDEPRSPFFKYFEKSTGQSVDIDGQAVLPNKYVINRKSLAFWQIQTYMFLTGAEYSYVMVWCPEFSIFEKIIRHPKLYDVIDAAKQVLVTLLKLYIVKEPALMGVPKSNPESCKGLKTIIMNAINDHIKKNPDKGLFLSELKDKVRAEARKSSITAVKELPEKVLRNEVTKKALSLVDSGKLVRPTRQDGTMFSRGPSLSYKDSLVCAPNAKEKVEEDIDKGEYDYVENDGGCVPKPRKNSVRGRLCHVLADILSLYGTTGLNIQRLMHTIENDESNAELVELINANIARKTPSMTPLQSAITSVLCVKAHNFKENTNICVPGNVRYICNYVLEKFYTPPRYPGVKSPIQIKMLDIILPYLSDGTARSAMDIYKELKRHESDITSLRGGMGDNWDRLRSTGQSIPTLPQKLLQSQKFKDYVVITTVPNPSLHEFRTLYSLKIHENNPPSDGDEEDDTVVPEDNLPSDGDEEDETVVPQSRSMDLREDDDDVCERTISKQLITNKPATTTTKKPTRRTTKKPKKTTVSSMDTKGDSGSEWERDSDSDTGTEPEDDKPENKRHSFSTTQSSTTTTTATRRTLKPLRTRIITRRTFKPLTM